MTWKSYAVFSGAGLLATYLMSTPVPDDPGRTQTPTPRATSGAAPADIAAQADRLQARVVPDAEYHEPSRNPFRFGGRAVSAPQPARVEAAPPAVVPDVAAIEPRPAPPPFRVSGISAETVDGARQRTAILATPAGIVTAREGETVADGYRVTRIEEDAVQFVSPDGTPFRLTLR